MDQGRPKPRKGTKWFVLEQQSCDKYFTETKSNNIREP